MSPSPLLPVMSFVIRATRYVRAAAEPPYFEIEVGADQDPGTPYRTIVTRDDVFYALACELEGTDTRVTLTWHYGRSARQQRRLELDALEAVH